MLLATFSFRPPVYERVKSFDGEERGQAAQGAAWRIGGERVREGTAAEERGGDHPHPGPKGEHKLQHRTG